MKVDRIPLVCAFAAAAFYVSSCGKSAEIDMAATQTLLRVLHRPNAGRGELQDFQIHEKSLFGKQKITARVVKDAKEVGLMTVRVNKVVSGSLATTTAEPPEYTWNP